MIRIRGRKILRDLWARKARTALASLSIFVGVLGVVVLVTMGDLLIRQLNDDLKSDELAMQQLSIVIATISSLWPSISAARKTVSEIIRYQ
jgi:uncharacterized membrane protein